MAIKGNLRIRQSGEGLDMTSLCSQPVRFGNWMDKGAFWEGANERNSDLFIFICSHTHCIAGSFFVIFTK